MWLSACEGSKPFSRTITFQPEKNTIKDDQSDGNRTSTDTKKQEIVVIKMKRIKNDYVEELIKELKTLAIKEEKPLWKRIATELEKPTRQKREVNIFKIEKFARDGETVIVPGKVLGSGAINKKVTVAALNFSDSARDKILSKKGDALSIQALMEKNPGAENIRIMG
ncbi:MAG: 50S ribosomal protein L18e [Candidatus Woesearchaeota archaeon]